MVYNSKGATKTNIINLKNIKKNKKMKFSRFNTWIIALVCTVIISLTSCSKDVIEDQVTQEEVMEDGDLDAKSRRKKKKKGSKKKKKKGSKKKRKKGSKKKCKKCSRKKGNKGNKGKKQSKKGTKKKGSSKPTITSKNHKFIVDPKSDKVAFVLFYVGGGEVARVSTAPYEIPRNTAYARKNAIGHGRIYLKAVVYYDDRSKKETNPREI